MLYALGIEQRTKQSKFLPIQGLHCRKERYNKQTSKYMSDGSKSMGEKKIRRTKSAWEVLLFYIRWLGKDSFPAGSYRAANVNISGKNVPGRKYSKSKGSEARM